LLNFLISLAGWVDLETPIRWGRWAQLRRVRVLSAWVCRAQALAVWRWAGFPKSPLADTSQSTNASADAAFKSQPFSNEQDAQDAQVPLSWQASPSHSAASPLLIHYNMALALGASLLAGTKFGVGAEVGTQLVKAAYHVGKAAMSYHAEGSKAVENVARAQQNVKSAEENVTRAYLERNTPSPGAPPPTRGPRRPGGIRFVGREAKAQKQAQNEKAGSVHLTRITNIAIAASKRLGKKNKGRRPKKAKKRGKAKKRNLETLALSRR
jgi:hypothetical protein